MKTDFSFSRAVVASLLALAMLLPAPLAVAQNSTKFYTDASGGFLNQTSFVPLAAYTTSGNSGTSSVDVGPYAAAVIHIDVTAVTGTGTLTVHFQSCEDSTTTYCSDHTVSSSITAVGNTILKVNNFGRFVYITYAISGFSSITFQTVGVFKPYT